MIICMVQGNECGIPHLREKQVDTSRGKIPPKLNIICEYTGKCTA